jgi:hypothetical protein
MFSSLRSLRLCSSSALMKFSTLLKSRNWRSQILGSIIFLFFTLRLCVDPLPALQGRIIFARRACSSRRRACLVRRRLLLRGETLISRALGREARSSRKASRTRRLNRFLSCALPNFLETVSPSRGVRDFPSLTWMKINSPNWRIECLWSCL